VWNCWLDRGRTLPGDEHVDGLGSANILHFEEFRFDRAGGCLTRLDGPGVSEPVALGSRALGVLALLAERQGQLVTKDEIMAAVWPGTAVEEGNLTVHISTLRRALDQGRAQGSCIQTVPGRGYCFVLPVTRVMLEQRLQFRASATEAARRLPSTVNRSGDPRTSERTSYRLPRLSGRLIASGARSSPGLPVASAW